MIEGMITTNMNQNQISNLIIGSAIEVHKQLGPGLLESAYETCLEYELNKKRLYVLRQIPMPIVYKDIKLEYGYRMDLLINNKVVIEVKSLEAITPVHEAQLLTYLKLGEYKLGLILNFHVKMMKNGIKRMVNNL